MKLEYFSALDSLPYFSIEAVRQLLGDKKNANGSVRTALYRWMKSGKIIQLKKGVYMTRRFYELHRGDENFAPAVSTILIPQSYISLVFILQRNAILSEATYPVSAVTIKQTRMFENKLGVFTYRHIKPDLYTGFTITDYLGIPVAQATIAKSLFDFFYFRPLKNGGSSMNYNLAEDLRLNLGDVSVKDKDEFAKFVTLSKSKKMDHILENLRKNIWRH